MCGLNVRAENLAWSQATKAGAIPSARTAFAATYVSCVKRQAGGTQPLILTPTLKPRQIFWYLRRLLVRDVLRLQRRPPLKLKSCSPGTKKKKNGPSWRKVVIELSHKTP